MSKHEAVRAQLRNELARLVRRVGAIEGDLRAGHDRDWEAWRGAAGDRARLGFGGRPAGGQPPRQTTPLSQLLAENYHGRHR